MMTGEREYRIVRRGQRWVAQMRFTASDAELRAQGILPGWRMFKTSVNRETLERAIEQVKQEVEQ